MTIKKKGSLNDSVRFRKLTQLIKTGQQIE